MPALSSTMTEGKVVQWLKSEGDAVEKGEALVVVESDKADMDVESFEAGFLGSIVVDEGGTATWVHQSRSSLKPKQRLLTRRPRVDPALRHPLHLQKRRRYEVR